MKKKKRKEEGFSETKSLLLAAVIIVSVLSLQILYTSFNATEDNAVIQEEVKKEVESEVKEEVKEEITVARDNVGDFISTNEGTFSAWTVEKYFKKPIDDIIMLFASRKIPGLALIYYPDENKLIGGTPPLVAKNVHLFNGYTHHVAYAFKEGDKQRIYYDGKLKAISDYIPVEENQLTGFVTGAPENFVSSTLYNVTISSEELTESYLTTLFR